MTHVSEHRGANSLSPWEYGRISGHVPEDMDMLQCYLMNTSDYSSNVSLRQWLPYSSRGDLFRSRAVHGLPQQMPRKPAVVHLQLWLPSCGIGRASYRTSWEYHHVCKSHHVHHAAIDFEGPPVSLKSSDTICYGKQGTL